MRRLFFLTTLVPFFLCAESVKYSVQFEGLSDSEALQSVKSASQLSLLRKKPPDSLSALTFRAQEDIPEMLKILHAYGYYEAMISFHIDQMLNKTEVVVVIEPGARYHLAEYSILLFYGATSRPVECPMITLENIGIHLGDPALSFCIQESQIRLLELLQQNGYPLSSIEKRDIIVDYETKQVRVHLEVQTGEMALFGPLCVCGLCTVKERLINYKMRWQEGDLFDTRCIDETQKALLDTGLFSSVQITHSEVADDAHEVAMQMEVAESKHKSIGFGATYQTFFGPGLTFSWESRNLDGMGRKLNIQGDVTKRSHSGVATLSIPHFWIKEQDHLWQASALYENLTAYHQRSYSLISRLDRRWSQHFTTSLGLKAERLFVTASVEDGDVTLVSAPLYFRISSANSLLNPTKGASVEYRIGPSVSVSHHKSLFLPQDLTLSSYLCLSKREVLVLAQMLTIGSILSSDLEDIPVPKRLFGGSEEDLRGYKYLTVSPLSSSGKPEGGRSALFYTFEPRFRFTKSLGIVPFFDLGIVQKQVFPTGMGKWRKSVGIGLRYFSFIGPIRFDIGFPLDPRPHIDPHYRIFVNIGQTF